jgi:hypothetical protein
MKNYEIQIWTISELLKKWEKQQLDIPYLRTHPLMWHEYKICNIFESLYKGLPIGSFTIWQESPSQYRLLDGLRKLKIIASSYGINNNIINPIIDVAFNPLTQEFTKHTKRHGKAWVLVKDIVKNPTSTMQKYKKDNPAITTKSVNGIIHQFKNIKNLEVPVFIVTDKSIGKVVIDHYIYYY